LSASRYSVEKRGFSFTVVIERNCFPRYRIVKVRGGGVLSGI